MLGPYLIHQGADDTSWRRYLEGSSGQRLRLKLQIWETPVRP